MPPARHQSIISTSPQYPSLHGRTSKRILRFSAYTRGTAPRLGTGVLPQAYKDLFEGSPSTSTVASFPSASLSEEAEREQERLKGHHRRYSNHSSVRSYPKRDRRDDAEENVSLWDHRSESEEDFGVASSPPGGSSLRLVPSSTTTRF
ncbi:hypothetical protein BV25DRAFT_1919283 [Artomyces pyxidatus]|uniref:Uncharacterized protein n=1 Tax=Artomyces pyxidatus TaxID=48021 RepID=A0ACB8SQM9_9AGAM|nr:hypothetical protein BV25DRAFT_1919283 [Artomyces pyxidatus]